MTRTTRSVTRDRGLAQGRGLARGRELAADRLKAVRSRGPRATDYIATDYTATDYIKPFLLFLHLVCTIYVATLLAPMVVPKRLPGMLSMRTSFPLMEAQSFYSWQCWHEWISK